MRRLLTLIAMLAAALLPAPARADNWAWPLAAPHEVVSAFDPPAEAWLAGHRGVDLAGRTSEAVHAAGAGTVAFAGRVGGVPVVSVRHPDGLLTTYEPVVAAVTAGDVVALGDRLGRLVRD